MTPAVKKVQIALTVIGLSGIILSFVPFTSGAVPYEVILDGSIDVFWLLVAPCVFLPILVSMGYVLWSGFRDVAIYLVSDCW